MAAFSTLAMLALSGASLGIQAISQHKAGVAAKQAANAQAAATEAEAAAQQRAADADAGIADFNASVADLQAQDALDRGVQDENRFRQNIKLAIGRQRAGFAAGNIDAGYGSAADVQADTSYLGELDALQIRTNAAREAWGFKVQSTDYRNRAAVERQTGVYANQAGGALAAAQRAGGAASARAGNLGAAATILGGTSSLLMARYGFGGAH